MPQPAEAVRCCCNALFPWCDFPVHQAEMLARAGLLADGTPPETPTERVRQARMFQDAPD